ncbi:MAG: antitoxin family protein [Pseudomonadota bacterium]
MFRVINAIFENGVFKPLEKVHVSEHKKLKIIIEIEAEAPVKKKGSLAGIIDIATDCIDTDISVHHDKFLYSEHN